VNVAAKRPYVVEIAPLSPAIERTDEELDELDRDRLVLLRDDLEQEISVAKVNKEHSDARGLEACLAGHRLATKVRYMRRIQAALAREKEEAALTWERKFVAAARQVLSPEVMAQLTKMAGV